MWILPLPANSLVQPVTLAGCLFSDKGRTVVSPTYGKVIEIGTSEKGDYVVIDVAGGRWNLLIFGVSRIDVKLGNRLKPGQALGIADHKTAYRIGLKSKGHPLYTKPTHETAVHPHTFHVD